MTAEIGDRNNVVLHCGSCRFFAVTQEDGKGNALGQCRYNPPIIIYPEEGKPVSDWPLTSNVGFCGHHQLPCVTEAFALESHELTKAKTPTWRQGFDLPHFGVEAHRIVHSEEDIVDEGTQGWVVLGRKRHAVEGLIEFVHEFMTSPPIGLVARFDH